MATPDEMREAAERLQQVADLEEEAEDANTDIETPRYQTYRFSQTWNSMVKRIAKVSQEFESMFVKENTRTIFRISIW